MPVERPQANGAHAASGASGLTFARAISGMTVYSAKVDVPMKWRSGLAVAGEARRPVGKQADALLVPDRRRSGSCAGCGSGRTRRTRARRA